jgi:hypothetical protein
MVNYLAAMLFVGISGFFVEQASSTSAASRVAGVSMHGIMRVGWITTITVVNIRVARIPTSVAPSWHVCTALSTVCGLVTTCGLIATPLVAIDARCIR